MNMPNTRISGRPRSKKSRAARRAILAAAVAMVGNRSARAITERDDVADSQYVNLSAQSQYASIGYVDAILSANTGTFASGVLIAPDWVLTVAHAMFVPNSSGIFTPNDITFGQGASTTAGNPGPNSVSQVLIDPNYNNSNIANGSDLALLQLATPITNVAPATIYTGSLGTEIGQTITAVGYGYNGTGLTGDQGNGLGVRRAMQNIVDAVGGQMTVGGPSQSSTYDFTSVNSNVMLTDFDAPGNPSASVMGGTMALPLEGATARGDSGGGAFVTVNGTTYLAGISSFEGAFGDNAYSTQALGFYGDFDGFARLSSSNNANFLLSVLGANSTWSPTGGGSWSSHANWSNSNIPEFFLATANFGASITAPSAVTLDAAWTVGTLTFSNANSYTIAPGNGGSLTLDAGGAATSALISINSGSHQITAPLNLNSPLKVNSTSSSVLTLSGRITGAVPLAISGNGTLRFGAGVSSPSFTALTINPGATLDITTNSVAINFASPANDPVATIAGYLKTGYNGGAWSGTGIISSTAAAGTTPVLSVGYTDGNTDSGSPASPNQILVKYTLAGDSNLDGLVNFADLVAVIQNFNKSGTDWSQGNFTYGTSTSFADLVAVVQNFNKTLNPVFTASGQLPGNTQPLNSNNPLTISSTSVQLPEPTTAALLIPAALLATRRRKK